MHKRYFRKKDPHCRQEDIEWIEMTGREFYRFVSAPENQGRFFVDLGDVVLESSEAIARKHRAEQNHSSYLRRQEEGWITLPLYSEAIQQCGCGEGILSDRSVDVETEALTKVELKALHAAMHLLDAESRQLIHALYLSDEPQSERDLARRLGFSQNAIHKQKKKILKLLKSLVVKMQKSQQ